MPSIELREITDAYRGAVVALHAGSAEGKYVPSVADSLAEPDDYPDAPLDRLGFVPAGEVDPEGERILRLQLR